MLSVGTHGSDISRLQQKLRAAGFKPGSLDGVFGANTSKKLFGSAARATTRHGHQARRRRQGGAGGGEGHQLGLEDRRRQPPRLLEASSSVPAGGGAALFARDPIAVDRSGVVYLPVQRIT